MFEVFVGLDAAVLRPLVVQRSRGVKEGNVSVPAGAKINLLQLQLVGCVQVLLRVPQHAAVQSLTCRGQQRTAVFLLFVYIIKMFEFVLQKNQTENHDFCDLNEEKITTLSCWFVVG